MILGVCSGRNAAELAAGVVLEVMNVPYKETWFSARDAVELILTRNDHDHR